MQRHVYLQMACSRARNSVFRNSSDLSTNAQRRAITTKNHLAENLCVLVETDNSESCYPCSDDASRKHRCCSDQTCE